MSEVKDLSTSFAFKRRFVLVLGKKKIYCMFLEKHIPILFDDIYNRFGIINERNEII